MAYSQAIKNLHFRNLVLSELENTNNLLKKINNSSITKFHLQEVKYVQKMNDFYKNINPLNEIARKIIAQEEKNIMATEPIRKLIEIHSVTIQKTIKQSFFIQKTINEITQPILQHQYKFINLTDEVIESNKFILSIAKQIKIPAVNDFIKPYKYFFKPFSRIALIRINLELNFWLIDDENIIEYFCSNQLSNIDQERYICEFYSTNNWEKLAYIVDQWASCKQIENRFSILNDCFKILKTIQDKNINVANAIIPTLIAQLEGIKNEIFDILLEEYIDNINAQKGISINSDDREANKRILKKDLDLCHFFISDQFSRKYADFYFQINSQIFKNSYKYKEEKKEGVNIPTIHRHSISHGDPILLNYGSEPNVVRLFLYLDFMIKILSGLSDLN